MTSKPMVVFQRKSLHLSLLCKALVRLDYFCLLFSFYLKRYKYFFSILLSHCFKHWDGYITTTDKLKWLVWGYRYIREQKGWWLKGENCFKLFIELLFLSLGIWEQLKKKKNDEWKWTPYEQSDGVRSSITATCIFIFWSLSSGLLK